MKINPHHSITSEFEMVIISARRVGRLTGRAFKRDGIIVTDRANAGRKNTRHDYRK